MAQQKDITSYLAKQLEIEKFRDYGPNGLQVEGKAEVRKLVSGVTASLALIHAAIEAQADMLLVHHGLFWRGQDGRITGWLKQRLSSLLKHDINLLAYHLPLDAHAQWGNNAQWGQRLEVQADSWFGEQNLGFMGWAKQPWTYDSLSLHIQALTGRHVTAVAGDGRVLKRIAWCTGGAQGYFEPAIAAGADVFITGEISEPQAHLARETGVAFLAAGHHATERYGAQALGCELAREFALEHEFIDVVNPA